MSQDRTGIYYWKCDRAAAFHGTEAIRPDNPLLEPQLRSALERRFPGVSLTLHPADGQGNHRTFRLTHKPLTAADGVEAVPPRESGGRGSTPAAPQAFDVPQEAFVRTEDGPERDNYFDVETAVTARLLAHGIPVPRVLACNCSRSDVPFAWQVLEYVPFPDLNQHFKRGTLELAPVAEKIGEAVACWQDIRPAGFGPFSAAEAGASGSLRGLHASYRDYYFLNLQSHLDFLERNGFFTSAQAASVSGAIGRHEDLLGFKQGVLVHKDLALWNILGAPDRIAAFIDWDDAISGDPMDDLSLLGCFHGAPVLERALAGYARVRPLPDGYLLRFWLCLLRNMLVKAVIRVGAGYFKRNDSFFLIGAGSSGTDLEAFTRARIETALRGLNEKHDLSIL